MQKRFNAYQKSSYDFLDSILVECPECAKKAVVKATGSLPEDAKRKVKLVCIHCGYNKNVGEFPLIAEPGQQRKPLSKVRQSGRSIQTDPFSGATLWLQAGFPEGILWAYNLEHLSYIENHISADLRVRDPKANYHESVGHLLPTWITSKKNRDKILKGIKQLKEK